MKPVVEGHVYLLDHQEGPNHETISFLRKEIDPTDPDKKRLIKKGDGTSNEEVLRMLIDRLRYLNARVPCRENSLAITKMEEALMWLQKRTTDRLQRKVEGTEGK